MTDYIGYTDILLNAYKHSAKQQEIITKKAELLNEIYEYQNLVPEKILFLGFSPWILAHPNKACAVSCIGAGAVEFLKTAGKDVTVIDYSDLKNYKKKFECVIAADEFFTFAKSEQDQLDQIKLVCSLATDFVVTTLKDYKNQDFKDKEFSAPIAVKNKSNKIFLEHHEYDHSDRHAWASSVYEITDDQLQVHGKFKRRQMFFKQLAKFSMDAGANHFLVQKNIMYKSLIKKNYEHIITIGMDSYGHQ